MIIYSIPERRKERLLEWEKNLVNNSVFLHSLFCKCGLCKRPREYIAVQNNHVGVGVTSIEAIQNCISQYSPVYFYGVPRDSDFWGKSYQGWFGSGVRDIKCCCKCHEKES